MKANIQSRRVAARMPTPRAFRSVTKRQLYTVVGICLFASIATYLLLSSRAATTGWSSGGTYYNEQAAFGAWRGEASTVYSCWADAPDDASVQSSASDCMGQAASDGWQYDVDIAVGFITRSESLANAANGAYESRWRTMAQSIRANWGNHRTVYIRPAHEFNGNWMPWSITNSNVGQFKQAWVRYYNIIQQELVQKGYDAKVVIGYNWGSGNSGVSVHDAWPGDAYVDVVGVDMYDVWWGTNPPTCITTADRWNQQLSWNDPAGNFGLNSWVSFASSHGKPLGFGEWGLSDKTACDNPYWITQMNNWFRANAGTGPGQILYEAYFNVRGYGACNIYPQSGSESPNGAATYASLSWGNGGSGGTSGGGSSGGGSSGGGSGGGATTGDVSATGNLLAGKTFSSSVADSTSESGHPVSLITDGNGSTRWISQPTSPVNLTADLGGNYSLSKVSVKWAGNTIKNFQFQISSNNSSWTTFYTGATNNTTPQYVDYTSYNGATVGRYFRIVGTDRWNTSYGNSIWEAGVYGTAVSTADTTVPTVNITSPAAGAAVNSAVTVSGSATDNVGVTKVELLIDGAVKATNTGASTSFSWNSASVGDGSHTIALRAYDAAGNSTTTPARSITVKNTTPLPAPTISSFTANPASLTAGSSTTLSWASANATGCSITPGGPTNTTTTSWQTAALTTTGSRTYTLTCSNTTGTVTRTVGVSVTAPVTPPAKPTFVASASTVTTGGSVTLSWSSAGATGCTLNPGNLAVGAAASKIITGLTVSTTYTLSCNNSAGSTSADPVTVKVTSAPVPVADPVIASFTAYPASISSGQSTTLSWITSGVTAGGCNLMPSPLVTTNGTGTWKTPALTSSASYTLTCVNSVGKQTSQSLGVAVNGQPAPAAPAPAAPPVNKADTSAKTITSSTGQSVSNAAASETVSGPTTFDPSNVTNSTKEQSILRVEYYNGETLVQTDNEKPFVLDTKRLKNGRYTITERTYFIDGSESEITRVVTVANAVAAKKSSNNAWLWLLLLLPILGGVGYLLVRRKLAGDDASTLESYPISSYLPFESSQTPAVPVQSTIAAPAPYPVAPAQEVVAAPTPAAPPVHRSAPDWQQGIVESSSTKSFNEVIGDPFLEADKTYAHSTAPSPLAAAPLATSHAQNNSDTKPAPQADAATTPAAMPHKRTAPKSTHPAKAAESRQTDDDDGGVIVIDHHKK